MHKLLEEQGWFLTGCEWKAWELCLRHRGQSISKIILGGVGELPLYHGNTVLMLAFLLSFYSRKLLMVEF
jgi:hypothetical protein